MHVSGLCQHANVVGPRIDFAGLDRWLGKMIQHEPLPRKSANKLDRYRKLPRINKNVVGEVVASKSAYPLLKVIAHQEAIVGFGLNDVPKSA